MITAETKDVRILVVYATGSSNQAIATLRYSVAAQLLGWEILPGQDNAGTVYPERVHQADAVFIQRDFPQNFSAYLLILEEAHKAGVLVVYDIDDLLIALPNDHPDVHFYEDNIGGVMYAILTADQLVVSTPLLHDIFLPLQPQITVWATCLPDTLWKITPPQLATEEAPLRIGYMGGISHRPDMEMIVSPLCHFANNCKQDVELHLWGCEPPNKLTACVYTVHHPAIENYADFVTDFSTNIHIDIWVAPLQPTLFNRCKSAIKFWEYSAVGGVGIYSDIEPYNSVVRHGENGFLANAKESWVEALTILAADPALRLQLAQNAQHQLQTDGLISTYLQEWQDIYTRPKLHTKEAISALTQATLRFSQQVQQRSNKYHKDIILHQDEQLKIRSQQLDEIHGSWWWRTWQRLKRMAHLDFSTSPPFQPFIIDDDEVEIR